MQESIAVDFNHFSFQPHDLIWVNDKNAVQFCVCSRPCPNWSIEDPLVVRRANLTNHRYIPTGIRGAARGDRFSCTALKTAVVQKKTPEDLLARAADINFEGIAAMDALHKLARHQWPFPWGPTGSCGYSIATGRCVMTATSDLDIVIRIPTEEAMKDLRGFIALLPALSCRLDVQIDTGQGGFSLGEWFKGGRVMLKTNDGPRLVRSPWGELPCM